MDVLGGLDQGVLHWFQAQHTPWLDAVMVNLTDLGNRYVVTVVALLAAVCFLAVRQYRAALLMVVAAVACWALVEGIKNVVRRERPPKTEVRRVEEPSLLSRVLGAAEQRPTGELPQPTHAERTYSFPSGHALSSGAVYLTLALLVARRLRRRGPRVLVVVGTALLVFVIGVTRLYLGAHYFTDVLAGWLGGLGVALICAWLDERWAPRAAAPAASTGPPPIHPGGGG
jgi:undecaprenyl-diphosphatase